MLKDNIFLVKIGKKENLEKMVAGGLYCSPSQRYVLQEKEQHDRGQGDLLEGKMRIKAEGGYMEDHVTKRRIPIPKGSVFTIDIQDVNNMPVFCMTRGTLEECVNYVSDKEYTIKFSKTYEDEVRHSFKDADSALIIYEPEKFIASLINTIQHPVVYDNINYYDYDIMDINMMYFLMGESNFEKGKTYSMVYDNRYRHLLCKHTDFAEQREFRIIMLDEKISDPHSYPFMFESKYDIVDLNDFFAGIEVRL